jgi:hypothetical protein
MKFNVFFLVDSDLRPIETKYAKNPVESAHLASLLAHLAENLPRNPYTGLETIGIRVEPVLEGKTAPQSALTGRKELDEEPD